jgi:hypothetical protein
MMVTSSVKRTHMASDDPTLTPELIVHGYTRAYRKVYGRDPRIRHIGGQWYYVGGETVHRVSLLNETLRLHQMAPSESSYATANRGMIQRLISRLRGA